MSVIEKEPTEVPASEAEDAGHDCQQDLHAD